MSFFPFLPKFTLSTKALPFQPFSSLLFIYRVFFFDFFVFFTHIKYWNLQLVGVKYPFQETRMLSRKIFFVTVSFSLSLIFLFDLFFLHVFSHPFPFFLSVLLQQDFNVESFFKSISSFLHFSIHRSLIIFTYRWKVAKCLKNWAKKFPPIQKWA